MPPARLAPLLLPLLLCHFGLVPAAPLGAAPPTLEERLEPLELPGLESSVRVRRDRQDAPHIFAHNDNDAALVLGYFHAKDRLFQMDFLRRTFAGRLAELFGAAALGSDIQLRVLGLARAADATWPALRSETRALLQAYATGVNAAIETLELPPEYAALELASVAPWTPLDTVVVSKGIGFGLSFDLLDLELGQAQLAFLAAGEANGFDGATLMFEDLYRSAPFEAIATVPTDAASLPDATGEVDRSTWEAVPWLERLARHRSLLEEARRKARSVPLLARALEGAHNFRGSNWWILSGERSVSGAPILANDPHLGLDTPPIFYEAQTRVRRNGDPPMNVAGVTFPGVPGVQMGCNPWICWGATLAPVDVTDVYLEELVLDPASGLPTHTRFEDQLEPIEQIPQSFLVNQIGDGELDSLEAVDIPATAGGVAFVVPRRNQGPLIAFDGSDPDNAAGLSVQYTGWGVTRELEGVLELGRARNLEQFGAALELHDLGSFNWGYADVEGNIAYFTSGEIPLREDLQLLEAADGDTPPFLIRDGTHGLRHEWLPIDDPPEGQSLPYEVLPGDELPRAINPTRGYLLNANNDPLGLTFDNAPLSGRRAEGGIYYLSPGYAGGFRAGRIERLFAEVLADGGTAGLDEMAAFQSDHRLLDAEILLPYLLEAFENLFPDPAAVDERLAEAIDRLAAWDFSTPTGIAEGYDPGDDPAALEPPTQEEIDRSVAATLYAVWRGQAIRRVIDGTLDDVGLSSYAPPSDLAMSAFRRLLDRFPEDSGIGASGLDFFPAPEGTDRQEARDSALLGALSDALDLLAGDDFAAAFNNSTRLDDYRWGYLHRIVLDHPLGGPFSIPEAGGFSNLTPELPGIARSGGFGAVDASSHSARADGAHDFMFGSGAARRFVGHLLPEGVEMRQVLPGGASGLLGNPFQADQLRDWLTHRSHQLFFFPDDVISNTRVFQRFDPATP